MQIWESQTARAAVEMAMAASWMLCPLSARRFPWVYSSPCSRGKTTAAVTLYEGSKRAE